MIFAVRLDNGEWTRATRDVKAKCPDCGATMVAKIGCGKFITPHWAHPPHVLDCNERYHDAVSQWHTEWQERIENPIPGENIEVTIVKTERYKRADQVTRYNLPIEYQKSPLPYNERVLRESHYGEMIWVVHIDRVRSKVWETGVLPVPIIFDDPETRVMHYLQKGVYFTREQFTRTVINGKMCDEGILIKMGRRYDKKQIKQCNMCVPRIKLNRFSYHPPYYPPKKVLENLDFCVEYCTDGVCIESKLMMAFHFLSLCWYYRSYGEDMVEGQRASGREIRRIVLNEISERGRIEGERLQREEENRRALERDMQIVAERERIRQDEIFAREYRVKREEELRKERLFFSDPELLQECIRRAKSEEQYWEDSILFHVRKAEETYANRLKEQRKLNEQLERERNHPILTQKEGTPQMLLWV
jgi:hypothetical protein